MAIKRYIVDIISCLSTDTKPTNVGDGVKLFKADAVKMGAFQKEKKLKKINQERVSF